MLDVDGNLDSSCRVDYEWLVFADGTTADTGSLTPTVRESDCTYLDYSFYAEGIVLWICVLILL